MVHESAQSNVETTVQKKGILGRMKAKLSFRSKSGDAIAAVDAKDAAPVPTPGQHDDIPIKNASAATPETTTPEKAQGGLGGSPLRDMRAKAKAKSQVGDDNSGAPATSTEGDSSTGNSVDSDTELRNACELLGADASTLSVSSSWKDKKTSLEILTERVCAQREKSAAGLDADTCARQLAAAVVIARATAIDAVAPVCFAAFDFLSAAFKVLAPHIEKHKALKDSKDGEPAAQPKTAWTDAGGAAKVEALIPVLLLKMNDTNKRMQRDVCRSVVKIAQARRINGLKLLLPFLAHAELDGTLLPLRPRLALLRMLLSEFGFQKGLLNLTLCMGVAVPALSIADDRTRKAAVAVVVEAHAKVGTKRVERHLKGVKPAMLAILQRKFAESGETDGARGTSSGGLPKVKAGSGGLPPLNLSGALPLGASTDSVNATLDRAIEARRLGPISSPTLAPEPVPAAESDAVDAPKYSFRGNYGCGSNDFVGKGGNGAVKEEEMPPKSKPSFQSDVFECGDDELMDSILADTL